MPRTSADLHTHTTFSDGYDMVAMVRAAADAGLEAIGLTDHALPYEDPFGRRDRYDFTETYGDRREAIADLDADVAVLDGVEVNYDPAHESAIRSFLREADFDYVVGSVHYAGGYYAAHPEDLADADDAEKREAVEAYVDWQVRLIESELVDVLGHLDVTQRSPVLRGVMEESDYRRLAEALADSTTVPEINAGRLDRDYGTIHPHPDSLSLFADAGVSFVVGTDSHAPDQLRERVRLLDDVLADEGVKIVDRVDA